MMNLPNTNGTAALPALVRRHQPAAAGLPVKTPAIARAEAEAAKNFAFAAKVNILVGVGIAMALLSAAMMFALPWAFAR